MKDFQVAIFERVVARRIAKEGKTEEEVLARYKKLKKADKDKIKEKVKEKKKKVKG